MDEREIGAKLMRIARMRTWKWHDHPEYPDMLAESYLRAWISYQTALAKGMTYPFQIAALGASFAPMQWLERWAGRVRRDDARSRVQMVPLAEADFVATPSTEALVLERLEEEEAWERLAQALPYCTPRQKTVLYRLFILDEDSQTAATALDCSRQVVVKVRDRALAHCRKARPVQSNARRTDQVCFRGHIQSPENVRKTRRKGIVTGTRCRLCENHRHQESRVRARERHQKPSGAEGTL